MERFEFVAPQYVENMEESITDMAFENLDSYFVGNGNNETLNCTKKSNDELYLTPCEGPEIEEKYEENIVEERISFGKLSTHTTVLEDNETSPSVMGASKQNVMENRTKMQDILSRKRKICTSEGKGYPPKKFISLAEAVYSFQYSTPPRFRLNLKTDSIIEEHKLKLTVPESPNLITMSRAKQTQSEVKLKTFCSKPKNNNPNNEVSQKMPQIRPVSRSLKKELKVKDDKELSFTFKARPVPRSLFPNRPVRVAVDEGNSPSYLYKNFFERGEELLERRQASVKKILEEEQKARENFLATPLPSFLDVKNSTMVSDISSIRSEDSFCSSAFHRSHCFPSGMNESVKFKARDARVLRMLPFFPKKIDRALRELNNLELNTDKRARDRAEFNKALKEKEELKAQRMKEDEEAKQQTLAQEIAARRKILVHTPLPLPPFYKKKN